jgi:hypothetical protein
VDTSSGSYLPVDTDGTCGSAADEKFSAFPFLAAVGYNVGGKIHYESDGILINRLIPLPSQEPIPRLFNLG